MIYLAKLEALDAPRDAGYLAVVPSSVVRETTAGGIAFRYPDAALIAEALRTALIVASETTDVEAEEASRTRALAGGLAAADADVLAIGSVRSIPVCFAERRASRLARSLGVDVVGVTRLLFEGTVGRASLDRRIRKYAALTQMRIEDLDALLAEVARRRT